MKVLVIGAGALGSLLGGLLSKENDVTIIGRPEQVWVLNSKGLKIDGITTGEFKPRALTGVPKNEEFDLIILCVKSYNTEVTLEPLAPLLKKETKILSLQNGLDNEEIIIDFMRKNGMDSQIIGGITCHGVTYKGPGLVKHAGIGDTLIGSFPGKDGKKVPMSRLSEIADAFRNVGFDMDTTPFIEREIWAKTIINSAINPLTAILSRPNGIVIYNQEVRSTAEDLIREGVAVANGYNVDLTFDEIKRRTFDVAERTCKNRSSMLQDLLRKRRTEVDSINGSIHEKGKKIGLECSLNFTMVRLIRAMEIRNLEGPQISEE